LNQKEVNRAKERESNEKNTERTITITDEHFTAKKYGRTLGVRISVCSSI